MPVVSATTAARAGQVSVQVVDPSTFVAATPGAGDVCVFVRVHPGKSRTGYAATVFAFAYDLAGKRMLVDRTVLGPAPLARVFHRLYELRFPIRHMRLVDAYGPKPSRPADTDVSDAFECRQAVASPCASRASRGNGHWSEHAYGHAVDLNPVENPYVGCGMSRDPASRPYLDRARVRRGMVTPAVVAAFRSIGWGWGGNWSGSTKDYMHFSASGH